MKSKPFLTRGGGGPKDPQLGKSLNDLYWVLKSSLYVFDFSYISIEKIIYEKSWNFFGGYPHFEPLKGGATKNEHPSTAYDPTFF